MRGGYNSCMRENDEGFEIKKIDAFGGDLGFEQIGGWGRKIIWTMIMLDEKKVRYVEIFGDRESREGLIRMMEEMDEEDRLGSRCELWETICGIEKDGRIENDDADLVHSIDW